MKAVVAVLIALVTIALYCRVATAEPEETPAEPPITVVPEETPPEPRISKKSRARATCAPELGLVTDKETAGSYVEHALTYCNTSSPWAEKHPVRQVLGFVGPWSDHAYTAAKYFRKKLTDVSPLWFRVLPPATGESLVDGGTSTFVIAGREFSTEQAGWVNRIAGKGCRVLPHFSLEGFDRIEVLGSLLMAPEALAKEILKVCEASGFAGVVFDVRMALFPSLRSLLPHFVAVLGQTLHGTGRQLMLSVPAPVPKGNPKIDFNRSDAAAIADHVDAVVVGTRDYSRTSPGPSAPLSWVRASILRLLATEDGEAGLRAEQLLLEVPLYGRAFAQGSKEGQVIVAKELVKVMWQEKLEMEWNSEVFEHFATFAKKGVILSVPTLAFVTERLRLARELGVGVALRELGAGLDYAMDLLPARANVADVTDLGGEAAGVKETWKEAPRSAASTEL